MNKTNTASVTSTDAPAAPVVHQEPTEGGSYVRNADGTLTRVQQTDPGEYDGRRRAAPQPAETPRTDIYQE